MKELNECIDELRFRLAEGVKNVVIVPHISPDGDAIGACSALAEVFSRVGIKWNILTCDRVPEYLRFLKHIPSAISNLDKPELCRQYIEEADLIFMLDHNTVSREGELECLVRNAKADRVIIDHHLEPDVQNIVISATCVSSTCELMYVVVTSIWGKEIITADVADSLYAGISTDTGGLSHNSSRPETYRIIASLLETGLNKEFVHKHLYQMNNISRLRLIGNALLNKLYVDEHYPVAIIPITKEELEKFNYKDGDLEGLVNIPLSVHNVDVSIQITERKDRVKLSFRSKEHIPVNEWAKRWFNGGGHVNAAGGQMDLPLDEVVSKVKETMPLFFHEYVK